MKKLLLNTVFAVISLGFATISMASVTNNKTSAIVTCPVPAAYADNLPAVTIETATGLETFKNCAAALDKMENTELAYLESVNSLGNSLVIYTYLMNSPNPK